MKITFGGELSQFEDELEVEDDATDEQINREIKQLVREKVDYWFRREPLY